MSLQKTIWRGTCAELAEVSKFLSIPDYEV